MKIRKIEPRDFAKVADLENQNWKLDATPVVMDSSAQTIMEKLLKGTTYLLAVSEETDEILGVLDFSARHPFVSSKHVVTFGLMTVEKARGKGVATALLTDFITEVRKEGYKKITMNVLSSNPAAIKLYEKFGFAKEGVLHQEFLINHHYIDDLIYAFYL